MVVDYELLDGVLVFRIVGRPDVRAFLGTLQAIAADDAMPDGLAVLIDVHGADGGPSEEDIHAVSEFFARHSQAFGPKGMVVASKLQYGLARMGKALSQNRGMDMEIFWDEGKALDTLRRRIAAE